MYEKVFMNVKPTKMCDCIGIIEDATTLKLWFNC